MGVGRWVVDTVDAVDRVDKVDKVVEVQSGDVSIDVALDRARLVDNRLLGRSSGGKRGREPLAKA